MAQDELEKKHLEVKAKQREVEESLLSLEEHKEDLEKMNVVAPHDGIVYYGMNQRGKWTTGATITKKILGPGRV